MTVILSRNDGEGSRNATAAVRAAQHDQRRRFV